MSDTKSEVQEPLVDLGEIVPEAGLVTVDGMKARVKRLRTRELLSLVRVLTRGLGVGMKDVTLNTASQEALGADLLALMILAIPEAVDDFTSFLLAVVEPVDNADAAKLKMALVNPELEVLLDVAELIATQEAGDLFELSGKAQAAWSRIQSVYEKRPGKS